MYRKLLRDGKEIESQLADDLDSHLNAEIAMGTINDLDDVMGWLETTFYYQRAQSAPVQYDFERLRERVRETLSELVEAGFVETDELGVDPTPLGTLASKYYLRLATAERFHTVATAAEQDVDAVLEAVATAEEFDSVTARQAERDAISAVLSGKSYTDDIEAGQRKVLAILHSSMTGSTPADLTSDAWVIRQNAVRLISALGAFCERFAGPQAANLVQRVEARLENGVSEGAVGLTAIDGIGSGRASKLASEEITTPGEVIAAGVDGLVAAGLSEGVAERVIESAGELPAIETEWGEFPESIAHGENEMCEVTVRTVAGNAAVGVRVTVNGVEMTADETYLSDELAVPVGVFGGDESPLEYAIEVCFPELPLLPVRDSRTVDVE